MQKRCYVEWRLPVVRNGLLLGGLFCIVFMASLIFLCLLSHRSQFAAALTSAPSLVAVESANEAELIRTPGAVHALLRGVNHDVGTWR